MIKIKVPATTANIGSGFDALGIGLKLYNTCYFEEIESGLIIEGCSSEYANKDNLIYTSMLKCFEKIGYRHKGIKIVIDSNIPVSRGLGSSATCILGGILGANELAGRILEKKEILELATDIEGHPDNVAPALYGGMVTSIYENTKVYYSKINIKEGLKFCALIPNFKLSTEKSRKVLPKMISHEDGVYNIGRVSLLISALVNGDFDLIKFGIEDKLHQKYRGNLVRDYDKIINKSESLGALGVFLSGAGPTIMAIIKDDNNKFSKEIEEYLNTLDDSWRVKELDINFDGAVVDK